MNTITRIEDTDILAGVAAYRAEVDDKHGPPSLDALSDFIAEKMGMDAGPSKATLSNRVNALVDMGMLTGKRGAKDGLYTFTLDVTPIGYAMINLEGEDLSDDSD
jgi:hypothetical protein